MMYGDDGWMWHGGMGWGGWILITLMMVVFWAAVMTAIVLAVRHLSGGHRAQAGGSSSRSAEDVLAERYARGEIDDDEFRRRLTLLREHTG